MFDLGKDQEKFFRRVRAKLEFDGRKKYDHAVGSVNSNDIEQLKHSFKTEFERLLQHSVTSEDEKPAAKENAGNAEKNVESGKEARSPQPFIEV